MHALLPLLLSAAATGAPIDVGTVAITVIEQVEVPAREAGELSAVNIREGMIVEQDQLLATIDDTEARLAVKRAQADLDIARAEADNDVKVRFAQKSAEVAEAELTRALDSVAAFSGSVSKSEIDRLRLAAERAQLDVEQSQHEMEVLRLTAEQKQTELETVLRGVQRRQVTAPIAGMVVQVNSRRGEWVQPGDAVVRVLRVDRLRAEGFLSAERGDLTLVGRRVRLVIDLPGKPASEFSGEVVFVSPEVNPVNNQVRIWADIDNPGLSLRPGLEARMTVATESQ